MNAVQYSVTVRARRRWDTGWNTSRPADGWEIILGNGHTLHVSTLDDAPAAVRNYLDRRQPSSTGEFAPVGTTLEGIDNSAVEVMLTVEPETGAEIPTPRATADHHEHSSGRDALEGLTFPTAYTPEPEPAPVYEEVAEPVIDSVPEPFPSSYPSSPEPTYTPPTYESPSYATPSYEEPAYEAPSYSSSYSSSYGSPSTSEPGGMELMLLLLSAREDTPDFASAATKVLPWIADLPGHQRPQCLADLRIALTKASNEYSYSDLEAAVARWRPGHNDHHNYRTPDPVRTPAADPLYAMPSTTPPAEPANFLSDYPSSAYQSPQQREDTRYGMGMSVGAPHGYSPYNPHPTTGRHRL
jgi:hypothetical protein